MSTAAIDALPASYVTTDFEDDYKNPRGIPKVDFIGDVPAYVKARGVTVENILKLMQEDHSKYKLMEHKLGQNRTSLAGKIPEINKTIENVEYLKTKLSEEGEGFETNFGLTESVFCEAVVPAQKTCHLWLGANTMVEFTFDEALALLNKNKVAAKTNLANTMEDLSWLKDQMTILEVNTARVYNFDVVERRKQKKEEK